MRKHRPSGVFIVWLGNDNRPHSKSIGITTLVPDLAPKLLKIDIQTEILLKQLDHMGGIIKTAPMVISGMSRQRAKEALLTSGEIKPLLASSDEVRDGS